MTIRFPRRSPRPSTTRAHRLRNALRPRLEGMEGRTLLSTIPVTQGGDDGPSSLRAAILAANDEVANPGPDTIVFEGVTQVTLTSSQLVLNSDVTIAGPAGGVTIARDAAAPELFRIFQVTAGATATLENLTITGGRAVDLGGGILNRGSLTVTASTLSGNFVEFSGGGIYNDGGMLTVTASTLSGNTARGGGGILNNGTGTVMVTASTLSGNRAREILNGNGGGIYNLGTLTVTASTLSGNVASTLGGGIYNVGRPATLNNTIVANSFNGDLRGTATYTGSNNLVEDGSGGLDPATNLLIVDPMLGDLADNGGPTFTHALLPGSPAIDAGSDVLAVDLDGNSLAFDQRGPGFPRIVGGTVDIGAFELTNDKLSSTTTALGGTFTYDGNAHAGSGSVDVDGGVVSITYAGVNGTVYSSATAPTDAGTYHVIATYLGDDTHEGSSDTATMTITPKLLDASAWSQGTINIGSNGSIVLHLAVDAGQLYGADTIASLFDGATFTIAIQQADGAVTYGTLTSVARVEPDGSITVSMQMDDDLRAVLYDAYVNGRAVNFNMTATAHGGNYWIDEDTMSRLLNNGALRYVV